MNIGKIVCPIDFSLSSFAALKAANDLAMQYSAELYLINVIEPHISSAIIGKENFDLYIKRLMRSSRKMLEKTIAKHVPAGLKAYSIVRNGDPAEEITKFADRKHADLIIMSTHGRAGLQHLIFGSVTENVIRHTPCPVVTIADRQTRNVDNRKTMPHHYGNHVLKGILANIL